MIDFHQVTKVYPDGHVALRGLDLHVAAARTTALLGPSGCGKTTTLKLVNRLISPSRGTVCVDGKNVAASDVITLRRQIGYVVQDGGLFPHLTAGENIEVVPKLLGWDGKRREQRNEELFDLVGLDLSVHGRRYPAELSGGQRQRVGLARALAADPPIVLMDEPFGALDPLTRRRMQREFRELAERLRKTVLLVTHDVEEAFLLASHVAVMAEGALVQLGSAEEVRRNPISDFVAEFVREARSAAC
ncbi:MAG TPA: ATP-binding cassette domain-containing protein [Candidatus Acidoferrales bacterium]|nr:ATP-binding cassette domain-containing protein [Candidatus Acidoferrales bacterium]